MDLVQSLILLVDDDAEIREALTEILIEEGFVVASSRNGKEAIEWLRAHPMTASVVLLDLMMPVMDGIQFLAIRKDDRVLSAIPVVVISASGRFARLDAMAGIDDYVPKPIEIPRLLATIRSCAAVRAS
jgi:CheY-like chemotaxis protein